MPEVRVVRTIEEARAQRLELERELMTLLEERVNQAERVTGTPGADVLGFKIEVYTHAVAAAAAIESRFLDRRQGRLTLIVAGVAAFATVVYAVTYLWAILGGQC